MRKGVVGFCQVGKGGVGVVACGSQGLRGQEIKGLRVEGRTKKRSGSGRRFLMSLWWTGGWMGLYDELREKKE